MRASRLLRRMAIRRDRHGSTLGTVHISEGATMRLSKRSSMLAVWFLAVPILATITEAQQGNGPEVQLQAAMQKELVEGDLDQAIELYRAIVDGHGSNRAVAARALLYLGRSYDKLGSHEAQRAYERLLSDYPEQEVASEARIRLAALTTEIVADRSELALRRVSTGNVTFSGTVSADGRYLPFWGGPGGMFDLMVRDLVTGEDSRLTHSRTPSFERVVSTHISPDGQQIAYSWIKGAKSVELRIIGRDGSGQRVVYANEDVINILPEAWTPDGREIFARFQLTDGTYQLVFVSTVDGSVRVVKSLAW